MFIVSAFFFWEIDLSGNEWYWWMRIARAILFALL